MFVKYDESYSKTNVIADVIVLGWNLPGIVTAHKLKQKFGDSLDVVILDLAESKRCPSKGSVAFSKSDKEDETTYSLSELQIEAPEISVAHQYLEVFAQDFKIPLPDAIHDPELYRQKEELTNLNKLFQFTNGQSVACASDYHDFDYLNSWERFELNQYQKLVEQNMIDLFHSNFKDSDNTRLMYYDRTTMEEDICNALLFSTSREIMRNIVRLVCGAESFEVSLLFYLHQCYRTNGCRNHIGGTNTRFREKLIGYCKKHIGFHLNQKVAKITIVANPIKEIRTNTDETVTLETFFGETNYVCNLLAMALTPEQLTSIQVEEQLLSAEEARVTSEMIQGRCKKFRIMYEANFWRQAGYSGEILSMRGPIIWAMERPRMSTSGKIEKYASLIGYLNVRNCVCDCKNAVIDQLVMLFGKQAETPVDYKETDIKDIFIPRCGDYIALRDKRTGGIKNNVDWGALDVFAEGDIAASLEAGDLAYVDLVGHLRPQAASYEDLTAIEPPTVLCGNPVERILPYFNIVSGLRCAVLGVTVYMGVRLLRSYMR